jgi:predicted MFS family arabinose efflux permease
MPPDESSSEKKDLAGWRQVVNVASTAPYSWYILGQTVDTVGVWMQRLAMGWLVWELTQSATWLGILGVLKFAPTIFFGLLGGVLADRFPRGRIVIAVQAVAVVKTALTVVLLMLGSLTLAWLVILELILGIAISLTQAASRTVVQDIVPAQSLPTAIALTSVVFNVSGLVGPAIAGVVLYAFGTTWCFAAIAVMYAVNLAVYVAIMPRDGRRRDDTESIWRSITVAVKYSIAHPGIAPVLAMHFAFTFTVRGLLDIIPAFVARQLGGGVDDVALVTSVIGFGAVVAGFYLAQRRAGSGLSRIVMWSMGGMGIAMFAFAWSTNELIASLFGLIVGGGMAVRAAGMQTLIQLAAREDLRGRVLSLYGLLLNAGAGFGGLLMGAIGDWIGLPWSITILNAASLLVLAYALMRFRTIEHALEPPAQRPGQG